MMKPRMNVQPAPKRHLRSSSQLLLLAGKENIADEVPKSDGCVTSENGVLPFVKGTMSLVLPFVDRSSNSLMERAVANQTQNVALVVGDLVWAFLSGSPLWPAVITPDPKNGAHTKLKGPLKRYHVEFLADNGCHSWLGNSNLIPFEGGYEELVQTEELKKHAMKKTDLFKSLPKLDDNMVGKKKNWPIALEKAKEFFKLSRTNRVKNMIQLVEKEQKAKLELKRKASTSVEDCEPKRKMPKQSMAEPKKVEKEEKPRQFKKKPGKEMKIEVCERCSARDGCLLPCQKCRTIYHAACIKADVPDGSETLICPRCSSEKERLCCLCDRPGDGDRPLMACDVHLCSRRYHHECLQSFHSPSAQVDGTPAQFTCPAHYCHTCVVELGELYQPDKKPLLRCIECPTAYHSSESCLAAGCVKLSTSQMKCFKHVPTTKTKAKTIHYNTNWCQVCTEGGSLICCERCPSSFHLGCLEMEKEPDGSYLCGDCTAGKTILHGDIVWCKIGAFRWWPGKVLPLDTIPVQHQKHQPIPSEFLVYFYGSHNSAFVHRGQVFHYQEGDQGSCRFSTKKISANYASALELVTPQFNQRQQELSLLHAERRSKVNKKPPQYNKIRCNKPIGSVKPIETPEAASLCNCNDKVLDEPCGRNSNCINRILLIECSPKTCSSKCVNQRFQKKSYPPLYIFNTGGKGWGLKSKADIKMGDFVIEYCGDLIDNNEFQKRLKAKQDAKHEAYYFLSLDNHRMIDAGPSGNLARFMNHSCQPNCETQKWTVLGDTRIGLFARHDIPAGSELTFNYQLVCAQDVVNESIMRQETCHCGAPNCAGFIGAKPKQEIKLAKGKKEKKKTKPKMTIKTEMEDDCFLCYDGGELVMCDVKDCRKVYHTNCLGLSATPKGHWTCPRHQCYECHRKASQFCSICPNSVCPNHASSARWMKHKNVGLICKEHSLKDVKLYLER